MNAPSFSHTASLGTKSTCKTSANTHTHTHTQSYEFKSCVYSQINRPAKLILKASNNLYRFTCITHFFIDLVWADCNKTWNIRSSLTLLVAYTSLWVICLSCLMLLDWGFLCEGSDFPRPCKECDFMQVLKCLISVPVFVIVTVASFSSEMESSNINWLPGKTHKFYSSPF